MSIPALTTAPPDNQTWRFVRYANNFYLQIFTLLLFAFFLNREGDRVPSGNELVYLLYFFKAYHPHLLATDWTFQETTAGHGFFNYATGWLTLLMPLAAAAWVGRIVCWTLAFVGLLRLGRHFKLPPWAVWLGIILWLIQRQSVPLTPWTEWIVGSYEAKCPAYICLIFAMEFAMRDKVLKAGLLAGLAFSFHTAVGLWGGAALGWAVMLHNPIRRTGWFCVGAVAAALPGLISSLPLVFGHHAISPDDAKFLVLAAVALCADPYAFYKPYVVLVAGMLLFAAFHRWAVKSNRRISILFQFEFMTAVFFAMNYLARAAGKFNIVELYPCRVLEVFVMLLFFWQLGAILYEQWQQRGRHIERFVPGSLGSGLLVLFGLFLFLCLPSPVGQLGRSIATHLHHIPWIDSDIPSADADLENNIDFRTAGDWIASHTPEDDLVIAPPWRADAFYYIRRPLIANWHAFRYDEMTEWRQRVEALVGDLSNIDPNDFLVGDMDLRARDHYRHLSPVEISALQQKYNACWLVTTGTYPYSRVFSSGVFNVYKLPALPSVAH